ncbi:hypothetical protein BDP27DRAFT_1362226 [Rhodocollybia butyracea]|uniref:Uncharacterized protein n=1 Tax=Rhodocollybia butyracea TaxID=206335 RepID=A0A9P5U9H9_9AGAR|nr:hypothetical protein BDP27DRAFT_1362226 [Rhodocollybia butyracea]
MNHSKQTQLSPETPTSIQNCGSRLLLVPRTLSTNETPDNNSELISDTNSRTLTVDLINQSATLTDIESASLSGTNDDSTTNASNNTLASAEVPPNISACYPPSNASLFNTSPTLTESHVFQTSSSYISTASAPIHYSHLQNLPSLEIWEKWKQGYYAADPLDDHLTGSIFFDEPQQVYHAPTSNTEQILPPQVALQRIPPECLPH